MTVHAYDATVAEDDDGRWFIRLDNSTDFEVESYVKSYIKDSDPEWVASVVAESTLASLGEITVLLEDPAKRLEVITWLRSNGWKVEPA